MVIHTRAGVLCSWAVGLAALAGSISAQAVIKVDFPVSRIYESSKAVAVGTVARIDVERRLLDVNVEQVLKGELSGQKFRVQIAAPEALIKAVAADQPVALFVGTGKPVAILHLADTWLFANGVAGADPTAWRVTEIYNAAQTFPGRTVALIRILTEMKAGKPGIQNRLDPGTFTNAVSELADLKLKPTFLVAVDVNADGRLDVVVGAAGEVKLLLNTPGGYQEAAGKWGIAGAAGACCAAGDVNGDGKVDLLIGRTLWLNGGDRFARSDAALDLPAEAEWLAVALADVTGDRRADAVVLTRDGRLITRMAPAGLEKNWTTSSTNLWKGGEAPLAAALSTDFGDNDELHALVVFKKDIVRYAAGKSGGAPADFLRLTGSAAATCKRLKNGIGEVSAATSLDADGNGKMDFLIMTADGGLDLLNRGFGCFLLDDTIPSNFRMPNQPALPFAVTRGCFFAPGPRKAVKDRRQSLLILTEQGKLYEL